MAMFKNILVPIDFSSPSVEAMNVAAGLALESGASLTLLHTWEAPDYAYSGLATPPADLWMSIETAARANLDKTLSELKKRVPSATATVRRGYPAEEILSAIGDLNADLVVMGTHGRRGLSRAMLGSIAEKVVRMSPVPVLTVRGESAK